MCVAADRRRSCKVQSSTSDSRSSRAFALEKPETGRLRDQPANAEANRVEPIELGPSHRSNGMA